MSLSRNSIRFRLTGLFLAILGTTLVVFSAVLYSAFVRNDQNEFDIALYNHAVDVAQGIDIDIFGGISIHGNVLANHEKILPFATGSSLIQVLSSDGTVIARSRNLSKIRLPVLTDDLNTALKKGAAFRTLKFDRSYRVLYYLMRNHPTGIFIIQVGVPTTLLDQSAKGLITLLLIGIPLTLILAAFGGLYWSGRALAPVASIIEKAKNLSHTKLSERLPVPPADDELRRLSLTLNELLDRLQQAFDSQERFIADASHELKTPLAILRGELDLMRSRPRSPEEVSDFLSSSSQELDHLSKVVEDLLLLARIDAGAGTLSLERVRIDELALEVISRLEKVADKKHLKIRFDLVEGGSESGFQINGDPDLLKSMIKNLVENAIKFSPEDTTVEVKLEDTRQRVLISVKDHGRGIPDHLLSKVFERFYRADNSDKRAPGAGLGLAIARRIAQAHGGTIEVQSKEGLGTTFVVQIPTA